MQSTPNQPDQQVSYSLSEAQKKAVVGKVKKIVDDNLSFDLTSVVEALSNIEENADKYRGSFYSKQRYKRCLKAEQREALAEQELKDALLQYLKAHARKKLLYSIVETERAHYKKASEARIALNHLHAGQRETARKAEEEAKAACAKIMMPDRAVLTQNLKKRKIDQVCLIASPATTSTAIVPAKKSAAAQVDSDVYESDSEDAMSEDEPENK